MDYLVKALALNAQVRVYLLKNTDTINEAIKRHNLWPSATSVLGKVMSMGLMMGSMLKGDQALTIKLNGNGPIGNVIVDANASGEVRGYVDNPHINFVNTKGGLDDITAIGNSGYLEVIKDLKLKDFFTSTIEATGNLASDFTYYFLESEQTRTSIYLGILVNPDNLVDVSGGILFQLMPDCSDETITKLEEKLLKITSISQLLKEYSLEDILTILFDSDYQVLETNEVGFKCHCSKETFTRALLTLPKDDLQQILTEDKQIETICHYCHQTYHFNEKEIENLIKEKDKNEH